MLAIATTVLLVLGIITVLFVHRIEFFGTHYAIFISVTQGTAPT